MVGLDSDWQREVIGGSFRDEKCMDKTFQLVP